MAPAPAPPIMNKPFFHRFIFVFAPFKFQLTLLHFKYGRPLYTRTQQSKEQKGKARPGLKDFGGEREMDRAVMAIIIHILVCFLIMETTTAVDTVSNSENPFFSSNIHWEYNDRLYDRRPGASESGSVQPHDFVVKEFTLEDSAPQFSASTDPNGNLGEYSVDEGDMEALLSLKKAFIDPYGTLWDWTIENSKYICWSFTIVCLNHRVVAIIFLDAGLEGTIAEGIANLSMLEQVHLNTNNLTGSIPEAIGNLSHLTYLYLGVNKFNGGIPQAIFKLSELTSLNLGTNLLTGRISDGIANLKKLERLHLDSNNISGTIPKAIGKLHSLKILYLFANNLSGRIPNSIGNLKALIQLGIFNTSVSGTIPESISDLVSLQRLDLSGNSLEGPIPDGIGKCVALEHLILSINKLNGKIPASLSNCASLQRFKVSDNSLSGNLDIRFPASMEVFSAYFNNFSGIFPASLANCTKLQLLDVRKNRLTGKLPDYLAHFDQLRVLSVGYNKFYGGIPQWFMYLTKLQVLDLFNNNFTGRIPSNLDRLQGFKIRGSSQVQGNKLYADFIVVIKAREYSLTYLLETNTILDLSNNDLNGEIPTSIGSLSSLRLLNLSGNQLGWKIPASLGEISTLEQLDLSKNNLSGEIPQELSVLSSLAFLNVSSNKLCGQIPKGTQLNTFGVTSFQKNKCLCCDLFRPCKEGNQLQSCKSTCNQWHPWKDKEKHNSISKKGWLSHVDEKISLIALGLEIGIGFGAVIATMITWDKARHWIVPPNTQPFYEVYKFPM